MSDKVTRKDFLMLAGYAMAGLMVDPNALFPEKKSQNWQMPVVFSFGDHYLHKEDVDPDRFSLIVGETSNLNFFNWHKVPANRPFVDDGVKQKFENLTYDLKNYGIGGTEGEIQNHLASLAYAKESGINMAFTDLNTEKVLILKH